ncbi:hypothetical protein IAU60_002785 [Kwoniella sp. DSM 27419]
MAPPPPSVVAPDHSPDEDRCRLLGTTGLVVQALMGVFVILSLVVKRQLERRKRSWRIWMYDVSKQLAGQAVVHGLNVLISDLVASAAHNNPCSLYFLNVLIDTTIGVVILFVSLKSFTWFFSKYLGMDGFVSGQYGHPPNPNFWWKQLAPYLLSIITMKLLVLLPLTLPGISRLLIDSSHAFLDYLSPRAQIIFVMAVFPVIMNIIQFCLVDQVIKAGKDDQEDGNENDDRGYRRVPGEGRDEDDDVEAGAPSRRGSVAAARLSKSLSRKESTGTPVIPSSPLLSPAVHPTYGSTSPSPMGSPAKSRVKRDPATNLAVGDQSVWTKIMDRINTATPSSGSSSRDRSIVGEAEEEPSYAGHLHVTGEYDRHQRSTAPSPDSLHSSSFSEEQVGSGKPDLAVETDTVQGVSRYPPEDLERSARWTLSPPESPVVRERADSLGLRDVGRAQR